MAASDLTKQLLKDVGSINPDTYLDVNLEPEEKKETPSVSSPRRTKGSQSKTQKKYSMIAIPSEVSDRLKVALSMYNASTGKGLSMAAFIEKLLEVGFSRLDKDAAAKYEAYLK